MLPSQPSAAFPDSSTTVLLPKSHGDVYARLMAASSPHSRSHYCEVTHLVDEVARKQLGELFREGCKRLPMPEGSLLLWNSKTLHQATLACASPTPFKPQSHTPLAFFQQHVTRSAGLDLWPPPGAAGMLGTQEPPRAPCISQKSHHVGTRTAVNALGELG